MPATLFANMTPIAYPLFLPGLGMGELAIILIILLVLFGPGKLPNVMKSLGDGVRQFKGAANSDSETPESKSKDA